jgi:surfeit locus 1 family protein
MGTLDGVRSQLLRPTAILTHLLVLAVAGTCIWLGQWQLDRLAEVRANNALLAERLAADPVDLAALADADADRDIDEAALEFRRVEVTGTFRPGEEVLQRNRDHQGQQGFHLLTPLQLTDGGVVLVRRGWVPAALSEPPVQEALPPTTVVTVNGILERPVEQPGFGPQDPDEGTLQRVFHTDTARLDRQIEGPLFPMVLRMEVTEQLPPGELPVAITRPVLDEANHLSYAVQWHAFAVIAVVTYGAYLWSRRRRTAEAASDAPDDDGPGAGGTPPTSSPDRPPAGVGSRPTP